MYRGCMYVPKDPQLCHDIVHTHHDSVMTSHPGQWKMLELVSHNYWWPGISHYVASYVAGCDTCNCCKSFPMQKVGKLTPNQIPSCCWEVISVDTIGELPESKGYNAILVVVDRLSKRIHAMPTVTTVDSTGVACLFLEHIWRHHRLPEAVISDRGSTFISNFSRELAALEHAADEMAWYYDHWRSPTPAYEVRAKVWLNAQNYMTTHCRRDIGSL